MRKTTKDKIKAKFIKIRDTLAAIGIFILAFLLHIVTTPYVIVPVIGFVLLIIFKRKLIELFRMIIDYFYYKIAGGGFFA